MTDEVADLGITLHGLANEFIASMHRSESAAVGAARAAERAEHSTESLGRKSRDSAVSISRNALAWVGGTTAIVAGLKSAISSAASFDTTIRQVGVATGEGEAALKDLSALAMKMGADTVFSAQEAGDAMLELAKGGMDAATIKGGALASTLTLASAGGLQLGSAASYMVQGLSVFNLHAEDSAAVAAALAGAANASTASVEDMGLALSQVGPGAKLANLSLQQTVGVLAAFAQNGIKGSDAGTSLKTMLSRLVPQTDKAAGAMKGLGLEFTDSHGRIKDIANIAQQLHDKLGPLSDAQRTSALTTIFGSDAYRAAAILMKEGAAGVEKYTRASSDLNAAQKMAEAATSGTAGALSQMSGSIDTAKLALGQALAPLVVDVANKMTEWANGATTTVIPAIQSFVQGMEDGTGPGGKFADVIDAAGDAAKGAWTVAKPFFSFVGDHPDLFAEVARDGLILAGALKGISTVKKLPGLGSLLGGGGAGGLLGRAVSMAKPLPVVVTNPGFGAGAPGAPGGKGGKGGAGMSLLPGFVIGSGPTFSKEDVKRLGARFAVPAPDTSKATQAVHTMVEEYRKGGTAAGVGFSSNLNGLLSGGLATAAATAATKGAAMSSGLTAPLYTGLSQAAQRAHDLRAELAELPAKKDVNILVRTDEAIGRMGDTARYVNITTYLKVDGRTLARVVNQENLKNARGGRGTGNIPVSA